MNDSLSVDRYYQANDSFGIPNKTHIATLRNSVAYPQHPREASTLLLPHRFIACGKQKKMLGLNNAYKSNETY
ncbi:MAG: hypothetical protein AAFP10_00760 [Pseudomonadota bacterium]